MHRGKQTLISLVFAIVFLSWMLSKNPFEKFSQNSKTGKTIFLYCAASLRLPIEEIANKYEAEYGVKVVIQYGGSGTLLSSLETSNKGDLYLAADYSYLEIAKQKGLIKESFFISKIRSVIAVAKGNPKKIKNLDDLLKKNIKLGLCNPDAASIGKLSREILSKANLWEDMRAKAMVLKPTVTDLANDIKLGIIDAGLIWDATVEQYDEIDDVRVKLLDEYVKHNSLAVLQSSSSPTEALRFAHYVASKDKGYSVFKKYGYEAFEGAKPWLPKQESSFLENNKTEFSERTFLSFGLAGNDSQN